MEPAEDTRKVALSEDGEEGREEGREGGGAAPTPRQLVKLSVVIDEADFDRDIDRPDRP